MLPQLSPHPAINRLSRRRYKPHRRGGSPTTSYGYGATPLPGSRTDANGQTINYTYDALQRLTQKSYPDSSSTTFTYDSRNNILTAANSAISYSFTYDAANRIKTVTDSRGYSISYDYDANGNRTKTTLQPGTPDQRIINYSYDDVNRLSTLTSPAGAFSFGYNLNNQRTTTSYPNQTTASYSYDDAGRLTSIAHTNPDTTIITSSGYTLDDIGNRIAKSGSTAESYSYDATYRILQAITPKGYETYSYDSVGNRTSGPGPRDTGYSHDAANRMTQGRQYSYSYDNNGNQIAKSINETKGWIQSWDYENRLITSERTKGAEKRTVTFKYDPFGRRIEKKQVATNPSTTETTSYVYDNEDIVLEISSLNGTTFYTHGPGIDEPLALERSGQFYYYHADGLASITAISDAARTVVQRYSYSVFGQPRPTTNFRNSYQYTGREYDKETGLYYYRLRYYDPMEGRFLSKDPLSFGGGDTNLYRYVQNNPINWTDPSGLEGLPPITMVNGQLRPIKIPVPERLPDFVSANVSVTIPTKLTGNYLSWSFSGSTDRYGNWYWSPIGPGVGRAPTPVSGSLTANWLGQKCKPTSSQLSNFLSGHGFTGAVGYWGGGNIMYSPGNGLAGGIGIVFPQAGGNYSYSYRGLGNTGITW